MARIDGLNPLATSRTTSGTASSGIDPSGDERAAAGATGAAGRQDVLSVSNRGRVMAVAAAAVAQSRRSWGKGGDAESRHRRWLVQIKRPGDRRTADGRRTRWS